MDIQEFRNKIPISLGAIIGTIAFIVSATWFVALVYFEFGTHDIEIESLKKSNEYTNQRLDRKVERVEDKISELENKIKEMEK